MFHRKAPKFDPADHPDILAALARMEADAYARGRADALAIARDYQAEMSDACPGRAEVDEVIERLEA